MTAIAYLKLKICFQIFSYLANSRYSFSPKPYTVVTPIGSAGSTFGFAGMRPSMPKVF
jgi:hypothetical protein